MRYQDEEVLRAELRQLVEDVEPSGDALARVLAAQRRRTRSGRMRWDRSRWLSRRFGAAAGLVVAATAVLLVVLMVVPDQSRHTQPVSVRPNSYLAQAEPGVVAAYDVPTGNQVRELATIPDAEVSALVADGDNAYVTTTARDGARQLLRLSPDGRVHTVRRFVPSDVLTARSGRVAYLDGDAVVVEERDKERRIAVPAGVHVRDLALDGDGALAVLTDPVAPGQANSIRVAEPGATSLTERPPLTVPGECGVLAITWSRDDLAALTRDACRTARVRVATLDRDSGQQVGAGVLFDMGVPSEDLKVALSSDRLGRFLLSTSDARQWVVDGVEARRIPPACTPSGMCARVPATFWG